MLKHYWSRGRLILLLILIVLAFLSRRIVGGTDGD